MYYKNTLYEIETGIKNKFTEAQPIEDIEQVPNYILWMINEIKNMEDAYRAARWIGWILRVVEQDLKLWNNLRSRELIRLDKKEGYEN